MDSLIVVKIMGEPQKDTATPNTDCITTSAHQWAASSLPPLPSTWVPRSEIRFRAAAAGPLSLPALAPQGAPSSQYSPTGWAGGSHPKGKSPPSQVGDLVLPTPCPAEA